MADQAVVPVKPWFKSKITWTQAGALAVYGLTFFSHMSPDQKQTLMGAVAILHTFGTGVLRIWYNGSVTPQSIK